MLKIIFLIISIYPSSLLAISAFPGAEGFGSTTRGPYSAPIGFPVIYVVNTTSDNLLQPKKSSMNGVTVFTGSLRACLTDTSRCLENQGRFVLFSTSGRFDISSGSINVTSPYVYVAGQTAPAPGVTITGSDIQIRSHDVIVRHIRIRRGDVALNCHDGDSFHIVDQPDDEDDVYRVVVDHCSFSWSTDELMSVWGDNVHDITISNCLMAEPLHDSCTLRACMGLAR